MNITLTKRPLANALAAIGRIIPTRVSEPNLKLVHMYLDTSGEQSRLVLQATNMNIDIEAALEVDVPTDTSLENVALPGHVFADIVQALPGEFVQLEFEDTEVKISSGSYKTSLTRENVDVLPELEFPEDYPGTLPADDFKNLLTHTRYACAAEEYQAIFRGVKLELRDGHSRAVATDGFRLAYYHTELTSGVEGECVVPAKSIDELMRLLGEDDVAFSISNGRLSLATGDHRLNISLMEGTFPDYERIIPNDKVLTLTIDTAELQAILKRVSLMADKSVNNRTDLYLKDGKLNLHSEGAYGKADEVLEVSHEGARSEFAVSYNVKYLLDALQHIDGDARITFSGETSPSLVTDPNKPSCLAMVVPLRVTG
ncbi:MAG: DNA polymerase III subunit beta [Deinococcota bacterium]